MTLLVESNAIALDIVDFAHYTIDNANFWRVYIDIIRA